ncbi:MULTISPECIES: SDR family NAD(P)-dependent oxidoreductase [unclassified Sphingobium]|uniref:SDR family NAD(P)-dependent oxidoreductase n=1 Tax=unclassified Sphingobium TaxID=2611147 RepID=UPI0007F4A782|nr:MULTISPECIES: SDR family NAD(P)-dependent oxidoreductase [unclassified Sphingobium]OAN59317.1 short-chain dehydrogenase [Sphingobium sp. TCM1]WIW90096.1 SDR family NAD(P)-dependent oxidoreductase [Sphingobium sp. V4]
MSGTKKVAVVSGASAGIGKAAARALLQQGWRVIGVGRDPERCAAAAAELSALPDADFTMVQADMALLAETARAAADVAALTPHIDALLNNAGGVHAERVITPEGHEATFASNHLAPFLLTRKLMPQLEAAAARSAPGTVRVVATSSTGHEHCDGIHWDDLTFAEGFVGGAAYCHAKLANILFTRELARRTRGSGIVAHAMHPGVVASNFATHCDAPMRAYMESIADRALTPEQAADTLVWLASAQEPGRSSGRYFHQRAELTPSATARDDEAAGRLWAISEALVERY